MESPRAVWVDGDYCGTTGTQDDPYCDPTDAIAAIGDDEAAVIKLVAATSPYDVSLSITEGAGKRIAIFGIGGPAIRGGQVGLEVGAHRVFVDNVRISDASVGVQCGPNARVWIDDSVVIDNGTGLNSNSCDVVARRTRVLSSSGDAIRLADGASLSLRASVLASNGDEASQTVALRVDGSSFDVVNSSVVDNRGQVAGARGGVHCHDGSGRVRNSVIVGPHGDSIECSDITVEHSVVDTDLVGEGISVVAAQDPAWFVDLEGLDVHAASGVSPLLDAAVWWPGDPLADIDNAAIAALPGSRMYAGADQP